MKPTVIFFLTVRFPTEKAYGVTTMYTARAIAEFGDSNVIVIAPNIDKNFKSELSLKKIKIPLENILTKSLLKSIPNRLALLLLYTQKLLFSVKAAVKIKRTNNLIWCRDISAAFVFCVLGFKVACEIHRTPNLIDSFLLRILQVFPRVVFLPITRRLSFKLKLDPKKTIISPMSINENEIRIGNLRLHKNKRIIGYIGSPHSSGNELDLRPIIEAAHSVEKLNYEVLFKLVGFSRDDFPDLEIPSNIEFLGRISRESVMLELDTFDIGLVIYPDTKYFEDSFPIKIVEYAARGVPIIASDTKAHRYLLGDRAKFFDLGSKGGLLRVVLDLVHQDQVLNSMALNGLEWVREFTYENRAKNVLQKFKEL